MVHILIKINIQEQDAYLSHNWLLGLKAAMLLDNLNIIFNK